MQQHASVSFTKSLQMAIVTAGPGNYDPSPVAGYKVDQKSPFLGRERFLELEKQGMSPPHPHQSPAEHLPRKPACFE